MFKHLNHWIYGKHSAVAALANPKRVIKKILITPQNNTLIPQDFLHLAEVTDNKNIINVAQNKEAVVQGIAVLTEPIQQPSLAEFLQKERNPFVLLLDHVVDPQNIGAIFRSAAAFSVSAVITTNDNAPKENASLLKAAAGTFELLPFIHVVNLSQAIKTLKTHGYWIIGLNGKSPHALDQAIDSYDKIALVLGSEEKGMRALIQSNCDLIFKINTNPNVESLNVSTAAAIALFQLTKRNQQSSGHG